MTKQINIYDFKNPTLDTDINAKFFSILSNNFPMSFKQNDINWECISHFIYGNLLKSIPSFHENINFKNFKLEFPYDENFHYKKNLSLYTVDIFNYINIFINNNPSLKSILQSDMSYSTNTDNTILNVLSSDDFNLGKIYNRYISLEKTKSKASSIELSEEKKINNQTDLFLKIYTIIQGLKLLMYRQNNFDNLEKYENFSFDEILFFINDTFGNINLSYSVNKYNIYKLYTTKTLEYLSIYEKILNNENLKNHIVKLFIINNYQKYNNQISQWCENKAFEQIIHNYINDFIKLGEEPEDFETDPTPYNITDKDRKLLSSLSIEHLLNMKKELLKNINISCNITKISDLKISSLINLIKDIKKTESESIPDSISLYDNNENEDDNPKQLIEDEIDLNLDFEKQMIHSLHLSNKTLINDKHPLSPLQNYPTTIDSLLFNNIIQFIYYNEFINLLNVSSQNNNKIAYELLFIDNTSEIKSIDMLQSTYTDLFIKISTRLFNNCIYEKLTNTQFKIALYFSNSQNFYLSHKHPTENFIEDNLFGELLQNISKEDIPDPPDNYINLINMIILNNKQVYIWIEDYIQYLCNMYITLSFHFDKFINNSDFNLILKKFIYQKFKLNSFKTYTPPILDSFKYKIFSINLDLTKKYNILFNKKLPDLSIDISSNIWNTILLLIEYLYSYKQDNLSMKLQYLLLSTQQIELSTTNIKKAFENITNFIKIDKKITNESIILSLILGIPISSKNPIEYIQTNPESKKLPTSTEFYSQTKNKIYTFYD